MAIQAECVLKTDATLGEGPLWDPERQVLWWVDITEGLVHRYDPNMHLHKTIAVGRMVGALALRRNGSLLLAAGSVFTILDPDAETFEALNVPIALAPDVRFNDGKCDPAGRFWIGTMHVDALPNQGVLYCLDADLDVQVKARPVSISNGLAWSSDACTMYYVDTPTQQVVAFDYDRETGRLSNRRVVVSVPSELGSPDGMTIDREGKLWIAHYGGSCVARWDPESSQRLQTVHLPAVHVTSCTFGGSQLDWLYITTAREGLSPKALQEQPLAGSLFRVQMDVGGFEPRFFDT